MCVRTKVTLWLGAATGEVAAGILSRERGRRGFFIMALLAGILLGLLLPVTAQAQSRTFMPMVMGNFRLVGGSGDEPIPCVINEQEQAVLASISVALDQRRETLVCNAILVQVARERARDMAMRDYFGHTNPDGLGPNYLVRQAGYRLPSWYPTKADANNIESIAAGYRTPAAVWQGWMNSGGHRTHLLGLHSFYAEQTAVGVGYFFLEGSRYGYYWVFLSAHPEESLAVQEFPE